MKTFFYLSTCSTCKRIMKELNLQEIDLKDIKTNKITPEEIDLMAHLAGGYEALFSRRSQQFKVLGLKEKTLSEKEYRAYILAEYTFLKRPVLVLNNTIFISNSKQNVTAMKTALAEYNF